VQQNCRADCHCELLSLKTRARYTICHPKRSCFGQLSVDIRVVSTYLTFPFERNPPNADGFVARFGTPALLIAPPEVMMNYQFEAHPCDLQSWVVIFLTNNYKKNEGLQFHSPCLPSFLPPDLHVHQCCLLVKDWSVLLDGEDGGTSEAENSSVPPFVVDVFTSSAWIGGMELFDGD
jgi:hypothetical protein